MPHLDAGPLTTDRDGCARLWDVIHACRESRPHTASFEFARLWRAAKRATAIARVREVLATHAVVEVQTIASATRLSVRRTRTVVKRLELRGDVLLQTTPTGGMIVRVLAL